MDFDSMRDTRVVNISSFLSHLAIRCAESGCGSPFSDQFPAAVLFADITGFTPLAERLALEGGAGTEKLSARLNSYFNPLVNLIYDNKGDIVHFAGDALFAIWPVVPELDNGSTEVQRAVRCALGMQDILRNHPTVTSDRLSMRIGLSFGEVIPALVGGIEERWEFLLNGQPLIEVGKAEHQASPGDVVVSNECWELIKGDSVGERLPNGFVLMKSTNATLSSKIGSKVLVSEVPDSALRGLLQETVLHRIDVLDEKWLSELRRVTVVFLKVTGVDFSSSSYLDALQAVTQAIQKELDRYEASIRKLSVDEKGLALLVAFGLPPHTHEDDPLRAIHAVQAIQEQLTQLGIASSAGITTGKVFCGLVGNQRRHEFTLLGDVVNLAARLVHTIDSGILCDATTQKEASGKISFQQHDDLTLKGKSGTIATFSPLSHLNTAQRPHRRLVGRDNELSVISHILHNLENNDAHRILVIEGDAGIGKSCLVSEGVRLGQEMGLDVLVGAANSIEKTSPYHAWRGVFEGYFGLTPNGSAERPSGKVFDQNSLDEKFRNFAPLLNSVLPLDLPDNEITKQMDGQARADSTNALLLHLLEQKAQNTCLMVVLEDTHWLDSASWGLVVMIARRLKQILLVLVTRRQPEVPLPELDEILRNDLTRRLTLTPLSGDMAHSLACKVLKIDTLPASIEKLIKDKCHGNPFFIEQLLYALRDNGSLVFENGSVQLKHSATEIASLPILETIESMITSRIDRLDAPVQLTLKVASVLGRTFLFQALHDIYPDSAHRNNLKKYMTELERLELISQNYGKQDSTFTFGHAITRDVIYGLLLYSHRSQLHKTAAEWYENTYTSDLSAHYPMLAYHWGQTENQTKTFEYLDKSGEHAFEKGAYKDAYAFLQDAQQLAYKVQTRSGGLRNRLRDIARERQLAEAILGLGNHSEGRKHLFKALALLGREPPKQQGILFGSIVKELIKQIGHRLINLRISEDVDDDSMMWLEGTRIYQRLVETYWFTNETIRLVHAGISALNLAEKGGTSPELARAYSIMCISAGSIPIHRQAEHYAHRALSVAQSLEQPAAKAYVQFITSVYRIGIGEWLRIERDLDQAGQCFENIHDRRLLGDNRTVQGMAQLYQGEFKKGADLFSEVIDSSRQTDNIQHKIWGLIGKAECQYRLGKAQQAVTLLEDALVKLKEHPDVAEELRAQGLLGSILWQLGHYGRAVSAADRAALLISQLVAPTSHYLLEGYAGVATVYLHRWEKEISAGEGQTRNVPKLIRKAGRMFSIYAHTFSIGRPRSLLWRGCVNWVAGDRKQAQKLWDQSLKAGGKLGMPYEVAFAHLEIGTLLKNDNQGRTNHLETARKLLDRIGAQMDLERAELALAADS